MIVLPPQYSMAQKTLTKSEVQSLKAYRLECEICKGDTEILRSQMSIMVSAKADDCEKTITDSQAFYWTSIAGALIIGFVAGRTR